MKYEHKYSFIMPYHRRHHQLRSTLESFLHHYEGRDDYEIVVVEDCKNFMNESEHQALLVVMDTYNKVLPLKLITTGLSDNWNPAPLYNVGVDMSIGEFLIITNPECAHQNNVLVGLDEEFKRNPESYVICACLSTPVSIIEAINLPHADGKWYQHSKERNVLCHFCAAMSRANYNKIDGFDNNYSQGVCFEDDDFRNRILRANIPIVLRDDLVVIHLAHSHSKAPDFSRRHAINKAYYEKVWGKNSLTAERLALK